MQGISRGSGKRRSALPRAAAAGLVAILWSAGPAAMAQTESPCDPADAHQVRLQISVTGMQSAKGNVQITIYPDDAEHFLDGKYKLARQNVPATLPTTTACFAMSRPGYYAVAMFHDENANGHMETNFLGVPTEGFGFSRNPRLHLGPPDLDQVRVLAHEGDNPIAVRLTYY